MRKPINNRIIRELFGNRGRYFSIFIILCATIAVVSGFFITQRSIKETYLNSHKNALVEDGRIELSKKISNEDLKIFDQNDLEYYETFFIKTKLTEIRHLNKTDRNLNKTLVVYKNRKEVNLVGLFEGREPISDDEILIDNLFAIYNDIKINDKIIIDKKTFKVVGLGAFVDYSTLLRSNTDLLMDNNNFGVASITSNSFDNFSKFNNKVHYNYSYRLRNNNLTKVERLDQLIDISKYFIDKKNIPVDAATKELNKRISFFIDDMGGDVPSIITLFALVLIVMGFLFVVIISNTIETEAGVIGTLLSSGYTRRELLAHYMKLPIFVTIVSAIVGNIIAYTVMVKPFVDIYYKSYSLFPLVIYWDSYAFIFTTIVPSVLIIVINYIAISTRLKITPLRFLRNELSKKSIKKAKKLPPFSFLRRFRLRIFLKNKKVYFVLFIGILLANVLLLFGLAMNTIFTKYMDDMKNDACTEYQVFFKGELRKEIFKRTIEASRRGKDILKNPSYKDQTEWISYLSKLDKDEINVFTAINFKIGQRISKEKIDITTFGINLNGAFFKNQIEKFDNINDKDNVFYFSKGAINRLRLKEGQKVKLYNNYRGETYDVIVGGTFDSYANSLVILADRKNLNTLIGYDKSYYNGMFANKKPSLSQNEIISIISRDDFGDFGKKFLDDFGKIADIEFAFSIIIYLVIMYIITKTIIDKYKENICYLRVFGYKDSEIYKIYIRVSTIAVITFLIILIPLERYLLSNVIDLALMKFNGYINTRLPMKSFLITVLVGLVTYFSIRLLLIRKIKKLDMVQALKDKYH